MNIANKLTMFRIVISFFFLLFLFIQTPGAKTVALFLFIAGVITDFYDGRIARKLKITTDFGKLMDPLADKILILSAFIAFIQLDPIRIPAWMSALIVAREFSVTAVRLSALLKGKVIPADRKGKQKMVSQTIVIATGLVIMSWKEIAFLTSGYWNPNWNYYVPFIMWTSTFAIVIHTLVTGLYYFWENRSLFIEGN